MAARIDNLRRLYRISQETLGSLLGVSQSAISKKLAGSLVFTAGEVQECARFFQVSTDFLYGLTDDPGQTDTGYRPRHHAEVDNPVTAVVPA